MLNKSSLLFIGLGLISLTSLCTFLYFKPKKNTKKDDVDTKKDDVDTKKDDVDTKKDDVDTKKDDVDAKKDDVDTKKDDVDENLNIIKNKDVVLFYY